MRIIHTADLHIGQTLNGWTRDKEHAAWLDALIDTTVIEAADAMLISGDIFDGINPSGESQRIFYDFLRRLSVARPGITIIITSGNHDPSGRLQAPSAILSALNIHVFSTLRRKDGDVSCAEHFVPLKTVSGETIAHVCAIPFLRASDLPGLTFTATQGSGSPVVTAARTLHAEFGRAAEEICNGKPVIAMGHLHCRGASADEEGGADRGIIIGGEHALPADVFPEIFSYVALGHIHRAQTLDEGRIRYCGSPFPLSASETGYRHGVTIIDIDDDGLHHRHIEIARPVEFLRFPAQGTMAFDAFEDALARIEVDPDIDPDMRPFVYVNLEATGPAAVLLKDAETLLAQAPVRIAGLRVTRNRSSDLSDEGTGIKSLDETSPEDLFLEAFLKANKIEPEERHILAFREALTGDA